MTRNGTRALIVGSIVIATFLSSLPAHALPPRNLGFESGVMTPGWTGLGRVLDTLAPNVPAAPSGQYFLVVTAGCFTHTVHQRLELRRDRVLSGLAAFQSNDLIQGGLYNDFGTITVTPFGGTPVTVYTKTVADVGGGLKDFSPFEKWSYVAPADGMYTLTYISTNASDCFFGSEIMGDAITTKTLCSPLLPNLTLTCTTTDEETGAAMPGETVHFAWGGPAPGESTAVTDENGIATDPSSANAQSALLALAYTGEFYGSLNGNGSTGTGSLV